MTLGLSVGFVIFIFLSIALGYATKNWVTGLVLMLMYIVVVLVWRFLTR